MKFGSKKCDFRGDLGGFWTLFGNQPPHPPTFGRNLPKKYFVFLSFFGGVGASLRKSDEVHFWQVRWRSGSAMMARVTEIHQILFLSPDFRFSHNVGIPAEIIQSKIGSRAELRKKRVVGWEVGGRRGDSTGLDNNFGSIAPSRFAKAPEFWLLPSQRLVCV